MHFNRRYQLRSLRWLAASLVVWVCGLPSPGEAATGDAHWLSASAQRIVGSGQGVYVETADGTVLVEQASGVAVHPASVSKIPTTLALLHRYGCDHRFVTTLAAEGSISNGTVEGDLLVTGSGDPFFVDENALLVAQALEQAGIHRIRGRVRIEGPWFFDWDEDADGNRLQQALAGHTTSAAWESVRTLAASTGVVPPGLQFDATSAPGAGGVAAPHVILRHRSQPLLTMAKALNDYSNNIFKSFAEAAGGALSVEAYGRSLLPPGMRAELSLGDGAGTDPANRISPRAAVRLLRALEQELASSGHSLVDILPVAGVDEGTLHKRIDGEEEAGRVVGKTGTFGDYGASALVGAVSTADLGTVYFAVLNHDVPVPEARRRQDRFVRALLSRLRTRRWAYQPDTRPAIARADIELLSRD